MADAPVAKLSKEAEERAEADAKHDKSSPQPVVGSPPRNADLEPPAAASQAKDAPKKEAPKNDAVAAAVVAAANSAAPEAKEADKKGEEADAEAQHQPDGKGPRRRGSNREAKENRLARDGRKRERSPDERRKEDRSDLVRSRIAKEDDKPKGAILDFGRGSEDKVASWKDKGGASKQELLGQGRKKGQLPAATKVPPPAVATESAASASAAAAAAAAAKEPSRKKSAGLSEGASQPLPIPTYFEHDDRSIGAAGGRRRRASSDKGGPHIWKHDKFQGEDKKDLAASVKAGARPAAAVASSLPPSSANVAPASLVVEKKTTKAT